MNKLIDRFQKNSKKLEHLRKKLALSLYLAEFKKGVFDEGSASLTYKSKFPHKNRSDFDISINGQNFSAEEIPDAIWEDFTEKNNLKIKS